MELRTSSFGDRKPEHGAVGIILGAILFLVPFAASVHTYDSFVLPKATLLTAGVFAATGALGFEILKGRRFHFAACLPTRIFFFFLLASAFSALASAPPLSAVFNLLPLLIGVLLMLTVASLGPSSENRFTLFLWAIFGACLVESLYVIVQAIGLDPLRLPQQTFEGRWRAYGTLGNPNRVAWFLSVAGVMIIARFVTVVSKKERLVLLGILTPTLMALLLTQSRGSMLVMFVVMGLLVLFFRHRGGSDGRKTLVGFMAAVVFFSVVFVALLPDTFTSHLKDMHSIRGRVVHWIAAVDLINQHPILGVGPGHFEKAFAAHIRAMHDTGKSVDSQLVALDHLHNEYLETAVETGLPGLSLLLAFVFSLTRRGIRVARQHPAVLPFFAGLVQICLLAAYDFPFREPTTWMLLWVCAGIIMASSGQVREGRFALKPVFQTSSVAVLVVLCGVGIYFFSIRPVMADVHYLSSVKALQVGDRKKALVEANRATTLAPYREEYRVQKALLLRDVREPGTFITEPLRIEKAR